MLCDFADSALMLVIGVAVTKHYIMLFTQIDDFELFYKKAYPLKVNRSQVCITSIRNGL